MPRESFWMYEREKNVNACRLHVQTHCRDQCGEKSDIAGAKYRSETYYEFRWLMFIWSGNILRMQMFAGVQTGEFVMAA